VFVEALSPASIRRYIVDERDEAPYVDTGEMLDFVMDKLKRDGVVASRELIRRILAVEDEFLIEKGIMVPAPPEVDEQ